MEPVPLAAWVVPVGKVAQFERQGVGGVGILCSPGRGARVSVAPKTMRKIESDLIAAIKSRKPFSKGNTTVEPLGSGPVNVRLHGNLIAVIAENHLQINACGWRSATTKSRLNAILRAVAPHCVIYQSKNKWLIDDARKNVIEAWDGTVRIVPIP